MNSKIALCADTNSLNDPGFLGIAGEDLFDQTWIVPFADALIARKYLQEHTVDETWVVSSDAVDGINLAAALKKDNRQNQIRLFLSSPSGSKMSRCQNADIIPICGSHEFANLYAQKKHAHAKRALEQNASSVKVRRIERADQGSAVALPEIDIDEGPIPFGMEIPTSHAEKTQQVVPERKSFTSAQPLRTPTPVVPATIVDIAQAADPATKKKNACVVSVIGGSGGSGKSSIATLTALLTQKKDVKTLLLDADFQFGDLKYLMGYKNCLNARDILTHPEQIEQLTKTDTWPALLAAPDHLEHSEELSDRMGELIGYLRPSFDLIVVNTGAFWTELQAQLLEESDHVFFVIDQRPSSVRACNHALDFCSRCGIATTSFSYLLNFCSKKSLLSTLDVSCALKGAKVHEIRDGGNEVRELLGAGMARKLSNVNNPFCSSIDRLLKESIYGKLKVITLAADESSQQKRGVAMSKSKLRSRQKRKAACY